MKIKAISVLLGIMVFVTILYFLNRILIKWENGKRNKRKKHQNGRKPDWIKKRRDENWNATYQSVNETELSKLTTSYVQTMLLLVACLILSLILLP
jgi:hypothetical protein